MADDTPTSEFLRQFQAFLVFLGHLWGILAGVSVFFPLSNVLLGVVPLRPYGSEGGVYDQVSPALVTTLATVVSLFTLLVTFITRDRLRGMAGRRGTLRSAWRSLVVAVLVLIAYLALHQVYAEYAWSRWGWGSGDPRKLLAELPLMLGYVVFFSLLTRAFVLLGLVAFVTADDDQGS